MTMLIGLLGISILSSAYADEASDQTLAEIDQAVKAQTIPPAMVREWVALLKDDNTPITVRERAAWGLGFVGSHDKTVVPALLQAANHKGLLIRAAAVDSLVRLRAIGALGKFEDIAKHDPILNLRKDATLGLGLLESPKAIATLVELAQDPAAEVRGAAALAMSALQSKKNDFTEALKQMAGDENPYVQDRVKVALTIAQRKNSAIRPLLSSEDADVRLFAAQHFLRNATSADKKSIQAAFDSEPDDDVRKTLSDALANLKKKTTAPKKKGTGKKPASSKTKKAPAKAG